jgi:hypothetical protein
MVATIEYAMLICYASITQHTLAIALLATVSKTDNNYIIFKKRS